MLSLSAQKQERNRGKPKKNLSDVFGWVVGNRLSIHFGEDKIKCILFETNHRLNKISSLDIKYGEIHIKQCHTVTYLGCSLNKLFLESQWL